MRTLFAGGEEGRTMPRTLMPVPRIVHMAGFYIRFQCNVQSAHFGLLLEQRGGAINSGHCNCLTPDITLLSKLKLSSAEKNQTFSSPVI